MYYYRFARRLCTSCSVPHSSKSGHSLLRTKFPELQSRFQDQLNDNGEFALYNNSTQFQTFHQQGGKETATAAAAAAVLVLLCNVGGESSLLFTKRSSQLRRHAGEISFPGGHVDPPHDASVVEAALRETHEELMPRSDFWVQNPIAIVGQTTPLPSLRGTPVTPVLGVLFHEMDLTADNLEEIFPGSPKEVDQVFTVTLKRLLEVETSRKLPENRLRISHGPVFPTEHGEIWGLTAYIIRPLLHKLWRQVFLEEEKNERFLKERES